MPRPRTLLVFFRAAYDEAFKQVDLLLMPTTPMKATVIPVANANRRRRSCIGAVT